MKIFVVFFGILTVLSSCHPKTVIYVQNHWPYCGGKLPDSTEMKGRNEGFSYHSFRVTEGNMTKLISTDEFGFWTGRLDVTKEITIMDIDKTFSFRRRGETKEESRTTKP